MGLSQISTKAMLDDLMLEIDIGSLKYSEDFIKSLNDGFKKFGRLTEKQEAALRKIYKTYMN